MGERSLDSRPVDAETATVPARPAASPMLVSATVLVFLGGIVGTTVRYRLGVSFPDSHWGFPLTTMTINLVGAFVLGVLLETLIRSGTDTGWRRRTRLAVGTGFCGGFTTYSSLAVAIDQMLGNGEIGKAVLYGLVSVVVGTITAFAGIVVATRVHRWKDAD